MTLNQQERPAFWRIVILSSLLVSLAGCLTTPVTSMVKLSRLSPLETDPARMSFAVRSPNALRIRSGDIKVQISFETEQADTSFAQTFLPEVTENASPEAELSREIKSGSRLTVARFSKEDALAMRQAQTRIKQLRANGVEGRGSLAVAATGCAAKPLPDSPILLTTWLRTDPAENYFVLTRDIDLRDVLRKAGKDLGSIPRCN